MMLSRVLLTTQDPPETDHVIIGLIIVVIAIAFLGPGAFSLEARMFGRREIKIPSPSELDS